MPLLNTGKIRALAVAALSRSSLFPDVPSMKEAGVPNFIATNWYGILVPTGTPKAVIERLHQETAKATALPDVRQRLAAAGLEPSSSKTPQEFGGFVGADVARWGKVIKQANIKLE